MAERKAGKRIQKTIQWDPDVWAILEAHDKKSKTYNMSATANDAVRYALFAEYRDDRDKDVVKLMQDLRASLHEHRKATARDITILQEGLMQLVLYYLMHTHAIPRGEQASARAQANARFEGFVEELTQKLSDPKRKATIQEAE